MANTFEDIAARLAENEQAVGALYERFAESFPEDRELWVALARDEGQHAESIRGMLAAIPAEALRRPVQAIRLQAVATMKAYVESLAERCQRGELTRISALALGRDIENSLLEGKLFDVLSAAPATVVRVDEDLAAATREHRARIASALERAKG
ncbi:MAG: hypothetical protein ACE148_14835 [Vicinamibacterales bacterium]